MREAGGRHSRRSFWAVLGVGCRAGMIAHGLFAALFFGLGLSGMVVVNLCSMLLYALVLVLLRARWNRLAVMLFWFEIVGHALLRSDCWDSTAVSSSTCW